MGLAARRGEDVWRVVAGVGSLGGGRACAGRGVPGESAGRYGAYERGVGFVWGTWGDVANVHVCGVCGVFGVCVGVGAALCV